MAKKKSDDQVDNVDEPNFDDPEDFVDDVSDQGEPVHLKNDIAMMKSEKYFRSRKNVHANCVEQMPAWLL